MNKSLYNTYADLEAQKNKIEEQQATLKFQILDELKAELGDGKNGVTIAAGSFTLQKKITYAFSKFVTDLEAQLKDKKAGEIAMDTAKVKSVTEYVVFRPVKLAK